MIVKYSHLILFNQCLMIGRQSYPATSRRVSVVHRESAECSKHDMAWYQWCQWCQWFQWFMENGWKWDIVTQTLVNCHITNWKITMENHHGKSPWKITMHFSWVNPLFLWAMFNVFLYNYQAGYSFLQNVDRNHGDKHDKLKPLWLHMYVTINN